MPRVTDEHRAARRRQITGAALRCVLREGFHKTTMADVIRESGMSAGAVYGYFKSKNDIIRALADLAIGSVATEIELQIQQRPDIRPADVLDLALGRITELADLPEGDLTRVGLQTWAEALRDPEIHAIVAPRMSEVRRLFAEVIRNNQAAGRIDDSVDADELASVMFALVPGFVVQRLMLGDVDRTTYVASLRTLIGPNG
jgi:AcrR family transcriptional regulator